MILSFEKTKLIKLKIKKILFSLFNLLKALDYIFYHAKDLKFRK